MVNKTSKKDPNQQARSTSVLVFSGEGEELSILLVKRKYPPFIGSFALPGGFLKNEEDAQSGAVRKLAKETSIEIPVANLSQLQTRTATDRDPRGGTQHLSFVVFIKRPENFPNKWAGNTVLECCWMKLKECPALAFDHGAIVCEGISHLWTDIIKPIKPLKNKLPIFLPKTMAIKNINIKEPVTFFPGTFNPWHAGHRSCLDSCIDAQIVVAPDQNPWKGNPIAGCRLQFYLKLCTELANTAYAVYPGFCALEEVNPTVGWIDRATMKKRWLLLGLDSFLSLPQWKDSSALLKSLTGIYVVPRDVAQDQKKAIEKQIISLQKDLKIIFLPEHQHQQISSTQLRGVGSA